MSNWARTERQPPSVFDSAEHEGFAVSLDEAADRLGVQRCELQRSVEEGEIPYSCVGAEIRFDMAEIGEWIKRRPVIVAGPPMSTGRTRREISDGNSPSEQACELPMVWGELWIDQLYADHRRAIVAALDDFASLTVGREPTTCRRSRLFGWLATASDEEFAEISCTYLERLLEDPERSVDQTSYLMMLLGRIRADAQRELAPALSAEHHPHRPVNASLRDVQP